MRRKLVTVLATAAMAAGTLAPAAAAGAAPFGAAHMRSLPARTAPAQHRGFNINGFNWGGYAATGSGFTSVSATWSQPSVTCNSTSDIYAPWVGIDGYGSSTVEQTGVQTDCSSGSPVNSMWYEMYPAGPVYPSASTHPVQAHDTIKATVTYNGSAFVLTLQNVTRGWTFTTTQTARRAKRVSAEVIIEAPGTPHYPNFGTISFTSATINGASLGSFNPVAMDPSNANGIFEAHTSTISGGTSFSIAYEHE